jgi:hypothetical protein
LKLHDPAGATAGHPCAGFRLRTSAGIVERVTDLGSRFRVLHTLDHGEEPPAALFKLRLLDTPLAELRSEHWATSERSLAEIGTPVMRSIGEHSESVVVERASTLLYVVLGGGFVRVQAAGPDEQTVLDSIAFLREQLPAPEPVARHDVPVAFWTYTPNGPLPLCARSQSRSGTRSRGTTRRPRERPSRR